MLKITDPELNWYGDSVETPESDYSMNRYGFLVRHSQVDGAVETFIPHMWNLVQSVLISISLSGFGGPS